MDPQQPYDYAPRVEMRAPFDGHQQQARDHLLGDWLRSARERMQERRQQRWERRHAYDEIATAAGDAPPAPHAGGPTLNEQGGLKELRLPFGFVEMNKNSIQPNWQETRTSYELQHAPGTRISYSRDNGWLPSAEAQAALKDVLSKPPHKLTDDEVDSVAEVIPKPPFGTRGAFTVTSMSTRTIDGKTVLEMDLKNDTTDRRAYGYFFNPKYVTPQDTDDMSRRTTGTLECIWFEAPSGSFARNEKAVLDSLRSAKFK